MSKNLHILPPDHLNFVVYAFAGIGALVSIVFVILTCLQVHSPVCKAPEKEDLEKLNSVEQLRNLSEDTDETTGDKKQKGPGKTKKKVA